MLTNTAANQQQANSDLQANLQQLSNTPDNHSTSVPTDSTRWPREILGRLLCMVTAIVATGDMS